MSSRRGGGAARGGKLSLRATPCGAGSLCGFSGSRHLPARFAPLIAGVVATAHGLGLRVAVGDATGADQFVRHTATLPHVFYADRYFLHGVSYSASLAIRSTALVQAVAASGAAAQFAVFVLSPCPTGLVPSPSPSACFAGFGSGSWASAALAVGLGLPLSVFWCGGGPPALPAWDGAWSWGASEFVGASLFRPAVVQPALF